MLGWELKTVKPEDLAPGLLSPRHQFKIFLGFMILFLGATALTAPHSVLFWGASIILATVTARLLAIDATHMVLLDIYTMPIAALGVALALFMPPLTITTSLTGLLFGFVFPFLFNWGLERITGKESGLGGGDIKLMAAFGAWLGVNNFLLMLPLACLMSLALTFMPRKTQEIPFGPGLVIAFWVVFLLQEDIQNMILQVSG